MRDYCDKAFLNIIWPEGYPLEEFLRSVSSLNENERCVFCLRHRMDDTAELAFKEKYDGFITTVLYGKFQKHDMIKEIGKNLSQQPGIFFYYQDFLTGWNEDVKISKEFVMYCQAYCGYIYSEKQRYHK